jgi:eukaryotic-like serine/threonine-protein kinase
MSWQDEWEVVKRLGGGGQGNTHLVKRKSDGQQGVLKTLRSDKKNDPQARARMHREAVALQTLSETAARVPDVIAGNTEGYHDKTIELYFVMTYIEGPTLDEYIQRHGRLSLTESIRVTKQVAHTLAIGHAESIQHRDLKPRNIIMAGVSADDGPDGIPFLVDYGLSFNLSTDIDLTKTQETLWNEFLSLPETNVQGYNQRDPRSDVTALAAIFYFCLTGHAPQLLRDANDRAPHRRVEKGIDHASEDELVIIQLNNMFDRAFSYSIASRFNNCEEFLSDVTRCLSVASDDDIDLAAIAAQSASTLIAGNRKARVAELASRAQEPFNGLSNMLQSLRATMGPFKISVKRTPVRQLPDGVDPLSENLVLDLNCGAVSASASRSYSLAARDMDIVVFAIQRNADSDGTTQSLEIAAVSEDVNATMKLVMNDAKKWLGGQMRTITTLHANDNAPPNQKPKRRGGF